MGGDQTPSNLQAAKSPFALDSYMPPGKLEAKAADAKADEKFQQVLDFNQRGDNYTLLTVLFALVLFFGAFANRFRSRRPSWVLIGGAGILLAVGAGLLLAFPKII